MWLPAAAALTVLVASSTSAALAYSRGDAPPGDCSWGASSIIARYDDGNWVVSQPSTSGCTSRP